MWLLLPVAAWAVFGSSGQQDQQRMIADIDSGDILAWSRHITGQDPNDMNDFDKFESVAIIPGRSARANGDTRLDDEVWVVVRRTVGGNEVRFVEQFQPLDWGDDPNYCWFVDCGLGNMDANGLTQGGTPATPSTYKYSYISQNGYIWGIPLADQEMTCLDATAAVNVGGGVVGLPFTGHPFEVGQKIRVYGTGKYDADYTVQAGTTANEIRVLASYVAKTFGGTETVIRMIDGLNAGNGQMVKDTAGNLYYGHQYSVANATCITKIETDGTLVYDAVVWPAEFGDNTVVRGLAITSDDVSLYVYAYGTGDGTKCVKFTLATGAAAWISDGSNGGYYDLAIDTSGNAYGCDFYGMAKFAVSDGARTNLTNMGEAILDVAGGLPYAATVDNDLGIVIGGGYSACMTGSGPGVIATLYNLAVRTFDDSAGDMMCVGDTYVNGPLTQTRIIGTGHVAVYGGYIFVIIVTSASTTEIHKIEWDGTSLTDVGSVAGPDYGVGLYVDLWGNLVAVNQDEGIPVHDVFYFYDTDPTLLASTTNLPAILTTWDAGVGGAYQQGNIAFNGQLGIPGTGGDAEEPNEWDGMEHLVGLYDCVYADGRPIGQFLVDANGVLDLEASYNVVIAGLNYFSILETMPLGTSQTTKRPSAISTVELDFHESMGAHVGSDMSHSASWTFFLRDYLTGSARDPNDGTVALPYKGNTLAAGDEVRIYGTTNYNGIRTLAADTNNVELRITDTYVAESFSGTETVDPNEPIELFTGFKGPAPFMRGMTREPTVYIWEWDCIPMTIRALMTNMEVTIE